LLQCNDIFKDSDGFILDIVVSIDRDNSELHVKHFGTEYNKKKYTTFVCLFFKIIVKKNHF
jgi:hypothetical protein